MRQMVLRGKAPQATCPSPRDRLRVSRSPRRVSNSFNPFACFDRPRLVLVDVRSPGEFAAGHIPGVQGRNISDTVHRCESLAAPQVR